MFSAEPSAFRAQTVSMGPSGLAANPLLLGQLQEETESQKMLMEERIRSERHRVNYEIMKAELSRVEEEKQALEMRLEEIKQEAREVEQAHLGVVQEAHTQIEKQRALIDKLKTQIPPFSKDFKLKEEQEAKFYAKVAEMEEVVTVAHMALTNQRHQCAFLKAECDRVQAEGQRALQEQATFHEARSAQIQAEVEDLRAQLEAERIQGGEKLRSMNKEVIFLQGKVQSLKAELEEARAVREGYQERADAAEGLQKKAEVEFGTSLRRVEMEKTSLERQVESLESKQKASRSRVGQLEVELNHSQEEISKLKLEMDEAAHAHRLEKADMEVASRRQRADLQRDRDALALKNNDLQHQVTSESDRAAQLESHLLTRDKELDSRVIQAREDSRRKIQEAQMEVAQLKGQVQALQKEKQDLESHMEDAEKSVRNRLQTCQKEKIRLETDLEESKERARKAEVEAGRAVMLQQKMDSLEETNRRLSRLPDVHEDLLQLRISSEEDKAHLRQRIDELQCELTRRNTGQAEEMRKASERAKRYGRLAHKLRQKLEVAEAELDNWKAREGKVDIKKVEVVPIEAHQLVQRRLMDLQHRQAEFGHMLAHGVETFRIVETEVLGEGCGERRRKGEGAKGDSAGLFPSL